jgi:hypothetical protein
MDHLALLLRREDYVEVINTTSMIINSIPKDEDPLYFAHFFDLWFYRLQAALRLVENKDETYQKLAEMEAAAFDDSQYANLYRQFFPAKFDDSGSILPFRLRLLSLQITAKVAASTGNVKEINSAISNLFALLSTVKNVLQADHDFITTEEEQEYFVKIWKRRKSAAEAAITAAFVQANNHGAALEFLEKLDKQNCPLHLLEGKIFCSILLFKIFKLSRFKFMQIWSTTPKKLTKAYQRLKILSKEKGHLQNLG